VVEVTGRLDQQAAELDDLSKKLTLVERKLEPVETLVAEAEDDYEAGWWERQEKGEKLPPERIREALCRQSIPEKLRGEHAALLASRKRLEKRIRHLGAAIDAQRSILSALKQELMAIS
jgi:chromosome segregation ATPase